jgi:hypothetical protein
MFVTEYDPVRIIVFSLHAGGPLTDADVDLIVASIGRAVGDASRQEGGAVTNLVVIETSHSPTAVQRKRIGEVVALVKRGQAAFVVRSSLLRAMITAISWFRQGNRQNVQSTHATYKDARDWLVARSGYSSSVFDAMERLVRSRVQELERAS